MDKETALLVVAKDLFLAGWQEVPGLAKQAATRKEHRELDYLAEEFLGFYRKLKSGVDVA